MWSCKVVVRKSWETISEIIKYCEPTMAAVTGSVSVIVVTVALTGTVISIAGMLIIAVAVMYLNTYADYLWLSLL